MRTGEVARGLSAFVRLLTGVQTLVTVQIIHTGRRKLATCGIRIFATFISILTSFNIFMGVMSPGMDFTGSYECYM